LADKIHDIDLDALDGKTVSEVRHIVLLLVYSLLFSYTHSFKFRFRNYKIAKVNNVLDTYSLCG